MATNNSNHVRAPVKLTQPQIDVLRRLADDEPLHQHWYTGKCRWYPRPLEHHQPEPQNQNVVNSLWDKDLIRNFCMVYYSSEMYQYIVITPAGREALRGAK